jgi:hypothetical protein
MHLFSKLSKYHLGSLGAGSAHHNEQSLVKNVQILDHNEPSLDHNVQSLDHNVQSLDNNVQSLDHKVQSLDHNEHSLDFSEQSLDQYHKTKPVFWIRIRNYLYVTGTFNLQAKIKKKLDLHCVLTFV